MLISTFKRVLLVAMLSSIAMGAYADDAPVFDVDNYPPQFDGQSDVGTAAPVAPQAQSPAPAPAVAPALTSEQRMNRVEQQISNLQQAGSTAKVDKLQSELQSLRGQVEELTHQLQQLQTQQRSMYSDLDKRLTKQISQQPDTDTVAASKSDKQKATKATKATLASTAAADLPDTTTTAAPPAAPAADKTTAQPNVAEEQQIYQTAYDLIKVRKYNEAIAALQGMLQKYPTGQFAANAHYWLGELYGLQGKNDQSAVEFANVVKNYPDSPKVSDAQLKLGLIYAAQFKWTDAKSAFKKVINHYPGSASARLAAEQLKQIKLAGH